MLIKIGFRAGINLGCSLYHAEHESDLRVRGNVLFYSMSPGWLVPFWNELHPRVGNPKQNFLFQFN